MSLREERVLFTALLAELLAWIPPNTGCTVALDEVRIITPRKVWIEGLPGVAVDAVHRRGSYHHRGLAADLLLYRNGVYVADGSDRAWQKIAARWESMHPRATSGIRWQDANHVSLGEGRR